MKPQSPDSIRKFVSGWKETDNTWNYYKRGKNKELGWTGIITAVHTNEVYVQVDPNKYLKPITYVLGNIRLRTKLDKALG